MKKYGFAIVLLLAAFPVFADGTIDGWVRVHGHQYALHPVTISVFDANTGVELEELRAENNPENRPSKRSQCTMLRSF